MDYELYKNKAEYFMDTYLTYIDEIRNAKSAVLFRHEFTYRVEWQRTEYSRIKTLNFIFVPNHSIDILPYDADCSEVIFSTPYKVAKFLDDTSRHVEHTITKKRYDMYRESMKEGKL